MASQKPPAPIGFGRKSMPEEAGAAPRRKKASDYLTGDDLVEDDDEDSALAVADNPAEPDPIFEELMLRLAETFEAALSLEEAGLTLTTAEVFERLQALYPSDTYTAKMVFKAMQELGFKYADPFRDMRYVWLFK